MLMSRLQAKGEFVSFHNQYLGELTGHLNEVLPRNYKAREEDRLTLSYIGYQIQQYMRPDILVSQRKSYIAPEPTTSEATPTLVLPIDEEMIPDSERIVVVHSTNESRLPVLVIEMLSPSNKLGSSRELYIEKRKELIQTKLTLVEIDLLHASPSPIHRVPIYPYDEKATPYYIAMTNPNAERLETALYQFGINQPIPKIRLPLLNGDSVLCDFDVVYQATFRRGRYEQDVDYANTPMQLGAYRQSDQVAIVSHLAKIRDIQ